MKSGASEPEFHNDLLYEIDTWLTNQIEKEERKDTSTQNKAA